LLNLGASGSGQKEAPEMIHPQEETTVPLGYESGSAPEQAWRLGRKGKSVPFESLNLVIDNRTYTSSHEVTEAWVEREEHYITRSFMICIPHQTLFGSSNREE
jgi:hypothetical protein